MTHKAHCAFHVPPGNPPLGDPPSAEQYERTFRELLDGLDLLLCDEDLDEDKLDEASGNLLPRLADAARSFLHFRCTCRAGAGVGEAV